MSKEVNRNSPGLYNKQQDGTLTSIPTLNAVLQFVCL